MKTGVRGSGGEDDEEYVVPFTFGNRTSPFIHNIKEISSRKRLENIDDEASIEDLIHKVYTFYKELATGRKPQSPITRSDETKIVKLVHNKKHLLKVQKLITLNLLLSRRVRMGSIWTSNN